MLKEKTKEVMIDVREKDEFEAEHVEGSILVPMSNFAQMAPGVLSHLNAEKVVIMCRSGNRARLALQQITQLGYNDRFQYQVYTGGIIEWKKQGKPTITKSKGHLPILRQVQLIIGIGVVSFGLLAAFGNTAWVWGSVFFGSGLVLAGVTGICGMANLMAAMPWNRVASRNEELCQVSPNSGSCTPIGGKK